MIPWLNVKGTWKQPSSIWGKANGVWQSLGDMNSEPVVAPYLYNAGYECPDLTGGWSADGYTSFMSGYSVTAGTKNTDNLHCCGGNTGVAAVLGTVQPVDLTKYSTLKIKLYAFVSTSNNDGGYIVLVDDKGNTLSSDYTAVWRPEITGDQTATIDISGLSGKYYIAVVAHGTTRVITVYSMWLQGMGNYEPFNEALLFAGLPKAGSLEEVLTNDETCTALAENVASYSIMKENYSADMTSAIDSNWNEGLNLLNYRGGLKCYLFKAGNQCAGITGGWVTGNKGYVSGSALGVNSGSSSYSTVCTNNKISGSFSTIYFVVTSTNGKVRLGMSNTKNANNTGSMSWYVNTETSGTKSGAFVNDAYACMFNGDSKSDQYAHISNIYIMP